MCGTVPKGGGGVLQNAVPRLEMTGCAGLPGHGGGDHLPCGQGQSRGWRPAGPIRVASSVGTRDRRDRVRGRKSPHVSVSGKQGLGRRTAGATG